MADEIGEEAAADMIGDVVAATEEMFDAVEELDAAGGEAADEAFEDALAAGDSVEVAQDAAEAAGEDAVDDVTDGVEADIAEVVGDDAAGAILDEAVDAAVDGVEAVAEEAAVTEGVVDLGDVGDIPVLSETRTGPTIVLPEPSLVQTKRYLNDQDVVYPMYL